VQTRLLIASCVCVVFGVVVRFDTDDYRQFLSWVKDAWTMAGITFKERCHAMRLDKSQLSRIESGELPLHAHRLAMLGAEYPSFFQNFAIVLVRERGLSPNARAAALLTATVPAERMAS
jgi:hypothetical protein